jgi:hypothetical protein
VFGLGPATRIYLAAGVTDMRKGFEGLYGLVRDRSFATRKRTILNTTRPGPNSGRMTRNSYPTGKGRFADRPLIKGNLLL